MIYDKEDLWTSVCGLSMPQLPIYDSVQENPVTFVWDNGKQTAERGSCKRTWGIVDEYSHELVFSSDTKDLESLYQEVQTNINTQVNKVVNELADIADKARPVIGAENYVRVIQFVKADFVYISTSKGALISAKYAFVAEVMSEEQGRKLRDFKMSSPYFSHV